MADILEEAGVTDPGLLAHFREPGSHARGCWALDVVLNLEPAKLNTRELQRLNHYLASPDNGQSCTFCSTATISAEDAEKWRHGGRLYVRVQCLNCGKSPLLPAGEAIIADVF